jgi:hypothetical protein
MGLGLAGILVFLLFLALCPKAIEDLFNSIADVLSGLLLLVIFGVFTLSPLLFFWGFLHDPRATARIFLPTIGLLTLIGGIASLHERVKVRKYQQHPERFSAQERIDLEWILKRRMRLKVRKQLARQASAPSLKHSFPLNDTRPLRTMSSIPDRAGIGLQRGRA